MDIPRILIVDDEEEVRLSLKNVFSRRLECELAEAGNGRTALELLSGGSFDVVFLDVKMPGISGIDVLKKIMELYPETMVLVITAYDSKQVAKEVLTSGAVEYFAKPLTVEVIYNKLSELLKKKNKFLPKNPQKA